MAQKKPGDPVSAPPLSDVQQRSSDVVFTDREEVSTSSRMRGAGPESGLSRQLDVGLDPQDSRLRGFVDREAAFDLLIQLACDLPVADGDEAVVRAMVNGLAEILPMCGVGVCFVENPVMVKVLGAAMQARDMRQRIILHHGPGEHAHDRVDPTRLFPDYPSEVIVEIPGDSDGATLHAAFQEDNVAGKEALVSSILRRAAMVLKRGRQHAEAHAIAHAARHSVMTLNAQMVQAEKLASLGQIAAGMVHELNNPLTSIVAYTDYLTKRWMAKREHADPDELERLRRIGESAHRLLRFTRDLVTYARPAGEIPIPVVLHGVIDQALVFCEHLLGETSTRVERRFGDGVLPVRGLPEQLTQVFVNLITNACHAMPRGGILTISTELVDAERSVRVVVADTGCGILLEDQARIFTPFFTTKKDGKGTGLGLAIVKSIVETHNGNIAVESEPDRGATFALVLPVATR
ncbi:ATP-binding protein [Pendulispora rubella]|uniref:histidine kinase n=1 Tax=Pendulispora rubella TaxID=2741070 RepID=A0ABZ2L8Z7_9BACT